LSILSIPFPQRQRKPWTGFQDLGRINRILFIFTSASQKASNQDPSSLYADAKKEIILSILRNLVNPVYSFSPKAEKTMDRIYGFGKE
jgi:hypothetical protein